MYKLQLNGKEISNSAKSLFAVLSEFMQMHLVGVLGSVFLSNFQLFVAQIYDIRGAFIFFSIQIN